ncbi:MAG: L-methionine (R)-S-oxide reductase [Sphingobacteriales bacterium]|jgi:L-methionine (R)-S-oxide reductase
MAESILIDSSLSTPEKYSQLGDQLAALVSYETDRIANMANVCAVLKEKFSWLWVGFYRVEESTLILGPFQGPLACTRIPKNKGVCGACWSTVKTIYVPNVDEFEGHIACSSSSKSELVLPVLDAEGKVKLVLDIDSSELAGFSQDDITGLENILTKIGPWI